MTDKLKPVGVDGQGGDDYDGRPAASRVAEALGKVACEHPEREFVLVGEKNSVLDGCIKNKLPKNVYTDYEADGKEGAIKRLAQMTLGGEICGFYTCENTQIVVPRIVHTVGLIDECREFIPRAHRIPPLIAELPKDSSRVTSWYLLDVGAGLWLKDVEQALFYAYAGTGYARAMGRNEPAVGLLNMGEEENKGDGTTKETFCALKSNKNVNFLGNVEPWTCIFDYEKGRKDFIRSVDVVVTGAKVGNALIKTAPAFVQLYINSVKRHALKKSRLGQAASKHVTKSDMEGGLRELNPINYEGALFLCLNAPIVKGHGTTQVAGMVRGLERVIECDSLGVVSKMRVFFSNLSQTRD